jgi:hypothetical protein
MSLKAAGRNERVRVHVEGVRTRQMMIVNSGE